MSNLIYTNSLTNRSDDRSGIRRVDSTPQVEAELQLTEPERRYQSQSWNRLKELIEFCELEYRIPPSMVEIISSVLIPAYPYKPVWLVVESDRHPFWVHLSAALESIGLPAVHNCAELRHNGPLSVSFSARNMTTWMLNRDTEPRIIVDTMAQSAECWRGMHLYHPYWLCCQESVRWQESVQTSKLPSEGAELELARLLKLVIDKSHRQVLPQPIELPQSVVTFVGWLKEINPELSPSDYVINLSLLISSRAALYGRTYLTDQDWQLIRYVLGSSVKQWYRTLFRYYFDEVRGMPRTSIRSQYVRQDSIPGLPQLEQIWGMTKSGVVKQLKPLIENNWIYEYPMITVRDLTKRQGFKRKKTRPMERGTKKYYDVTDYGELMIDLLFKPEFDLRQLDDRLSRVELDDRKNS